MTTISSVRLTSFISQALASETSSSRSVPKDAKDLQSAFTRSATELSRGFQNLNQFAAVLTYGEDSLEQLAQIVDKVITIADKAFKQSSFRDNATTEFKKLGREYERVVNKAKVDGESLVNMEGLEKVFEAFGLDKELAESVAEVFSRFVAKGSDDSLADRTQRGKRPIISNDVSEEVVGTGTFGAETTFGAVPGALISTFTFGDFDGDGDNDISFIADTAGTQSLYSVIGNGDGTFGAALTVTGFSSTLTTQMFAFDYDQDGRQDIVIGDRDSATNGFKVIELTSSTTFATLADSPVSLGSSGTYDYFAVADMNNDGDDDIATVDSAGNLLGNASNYGTGGIASYTLRAVSASPLPLTLSDYDGDGFKDWVVLDSSGSTVTAYKNPSGGAIPINGKTTSLADTGAVAIKSADLDNDGTQDLFTQYMGTFRYYLGNGDGTFRTPVTALSGIPTTRSVEPAKDFDNDGDIDLLFAGDSGGSGIYRNNGNGTFATAETFGLAAGTTQTRGARFVDYNNDGFLDLLTVYNDRFGVRLQNTQIEEVEASSGKLKELPSLFNSERRLTSKAEAKLVLTDAKELRQQISKNLAAFQKAKEYIQDTLELVRTTTIGLNDIGNSITRASDASELAGLLQSKLRSLPRDKLKGLDALEGILGNVRTRAVA